MSAASIRALLDEGLDRGFFAGAAALVEEHGHTAAEVYAGSARVEPVSETSDAGPDTLWDLASLTKPLAGTSLTLTLASERALSLDDPVGRFDDLFKRTRFDGVTARSLLTHTAGFPDWYPCYARGEGRRAYRKALAELAPAGVPGRSVVYSCLGFLLLADIVEKVAATGLDRLFRERVSGPLGLDADIRFLNATADTARAAGGERDDATERRKVAAKGLRYAGFRTGVVNGEVNDGNAYRRAGGLSLNAGLFGTARAVCAMGRAWLEKDARLLPESQIADALENATAGLEEDRGLGWQLASTKGSAGSPLSPEGFGHSAFTGCSLFVDPPTRRVHVLLTNRLHPDAREVDMNGFRRRFHELGTRLN